MPAEFWWGVFGGASVEAIQLYTLRQLPKDRRPQWLKSPFYWAITAIMVVAGGGLVMLYIASGMTIKALVAFNIGVSAPLILKEGSQAVQKPRLSDQDSRDDD
jgi:hypothetical protein